MTNEPGRNPILFANRQRELLLLVAGVEGAVGSTVAAAAAGMQACPDSVTPFLTVPG